MKNLIPMIDFVLEQDLIFPIGRTDSDMVKYGLFLSQKLELYMFIPCKLVDDVWVVLEEPTHLQKMQAGWADNPLDDNFYMVKEYQEAKDRVLFEGFTVKNGIVFTPENQVLIQKSMLEKMTIENLTGLNHKLTLTAQKQIGC